MVDVNPTLRGIILHVYESKIKRQRLAKQIFKMLQFNYIDLQEIYFKIKKGEKNVRRYTMKVITKRELEWLC